MSFYVLYYCFTEITHVLHVASPRFFYENISSNWFITNWRKSKKSWMYFTSGELINSCQFKLSQLQLIILDEKHIPVDYR